MEHDGRNMFALCISYKKLGLKVIPSESPRQYHGWKLLSNLYETVVAILAGMKSEILIENKRKVCKRTIFTVCSVNFFSQGYIKDELLIYNIFE